VSGSLRQRGEQSWQLRVHAGRDSNTGRKLYVEKTFHGTKRQAERALAALVFEAESLFPRNNKEATLGRLLNEWLEHSSPSFSPRTVTVTRMYIDKTIIPKLGDTPVSKLSPVDLDRFYRHLLNVGGPRGKYSPATIRRIHGIIRCALSQGVRWGWLRHNPALDASPPRVPVRRLSPPEPERLAFLFAGCRRPNRMRSCNSSRSPR
jgi:integrase